MPRRATVEDLTLHIFRRGLIPRLNLDSADHVVADQGYRTISNTAHTFPVVGPLYCYVTLSFRNVVVPQHKSADHGYPRI